MMRLYTILLISAALFVSCKDDSSSPENHAPAAPTLTQPANNAIGVSTSPTLYWNASNGAENYSIQVSRNIEFTDLVFFQHELTTASKQIANLEYYAQYFWRVSAKNSSGSSDYSLICSFITARREVSIIAPTLSAPGDGAAGVATTPTLEWNASAGATSYNLQVSKNNTFAALDYDQSGLTGTSQPVNGLAVSTTYYWRVSGVNADGASPYSEIRSFTTGTVASAMSCAGMPTVTYQSRTYNTVQIGEQCWLKENLNVGVMIPWNQEAKMNSVIEKSCYNDDSLNCEKYGGFYNWQEAMEYKASAYPKGICPEGFHIPTLAEMQKLINLIGNNSSALKSVGEGVDVGAGTNTSGFSLLLGGYKNSDNFFYGKESDTYFWCSTEIFELIFGDYYASYNAYYMHIYGSGNYILLKNQSKNNSNSIRCIKG